jgi:hypothetical protein
MLDNSEGRQATATAPNPEPVPVATVASGMKGDEIDMSPESLAPGEPWWRDHYLWLKEAGYLLRPRYEPGWIPSWVGTKKIWYNCEDGQGPWV